MILSIFKQTVERVTITSTTENTYDVRNWMAEHGYAIKNGEMDLDGGQIIYRFEGERVMNTEEVKK